MFTAPAPFTKFSMYKMDMKFVFMSCIMMVNKLLFFKICLKIWQAIHFYDKHRPTEISTILQLYIRQKLEINATARL